MGDEGVVRRKKLDKFSDLPDNVIDIILSRIPLLNAVRTSVLSTKWRFHWTRIESLRLDWIFFNNVLDAGLEDDVIVDAYASIVSSILTSHRGRIREFFLYVPDYIPVPNPNHINMWILYVSGCGVQDLTLEYENRDDLHRLPSSLFRCLELKHLSLRYVELDFPRKFREFSFLVSLELVGLYLSGEVVTNITLNCPLLERLSLDYEGINKYNGHAIISSPRLKLLSVECHEIVDLILENTPNISTFSLQQMQCIPDFANENSECRDMSDTFRAIPKVENIKLNGYALGIWDRENDLEKLPAPLENHRSLVITNLDICSPGELRSMFCLIKISPKLETLDISMGCIDHQSTRDYTYLRSQVREAEQLESLRFIKLTGLKGSESEIIFIELFLSRCPVLEKLYLSSHRIISYDDEYEMMRNVMRFRRASNQVEVFYS